MRLKNYLIFVILLVINQLQVKAQDTDFELYTIPKGEQRSTTGFDFVNTNKFRFACKFDKSAIYKTTDPNNQADINKLYGFSDCFSGHQNNSARFGWRWYNNKLEIHAYCYVDEERISELLTTVEFDKVYEYEIELKDNQYIFKVNKAMKVLKRGCDGLSFGYKLYPFFGGDEMSPNEIKIWIKDLESE